MIRDAAVLEPTPLCCERSTYYSTVGSYAGGRLQVPAPFPSGAM